MPAQVTCDPRGCSDNPAAQAGATRQRAQTRRESDAAPTQVADANGNGAIVGGRPSACPHRFCGCEASLYVFGAIRAELNLAANWVRKFPRTEPAAGMVAARSGPAPTITRRTRSRVRKAPERKRAMNPAMAGGYKGRT